MRRNAEVGDITYISCNSVSAFQETFEECQLTNDEDERVLFLLVLNAMTTQSRMWIADNPRGIADLPIAAIGSISPGKFIVSSSQKWRPRRGRRGSAASARPACILERNLARSHCESVPVRSRWITFFGESSGPCKGTSITEQR